jgi:hypothetical protein
MVWWVSRARPKGSTWAHCIATGGFYVTPDKGKALLFGATFLGEKCASHGGVVLMRASTLFCQRVLE